MKKATKEKGDYTMKKILAFVLSVILVFSLGVPMAYAATENEQTPMIYIRGNGEPLYNAQGERIAAEFEDVSLGGDEGEDSTEKIIETTVNIIKPFVLEGLLSDKWDNYGKAVYDELSPLFEEAILDGNGNPKNGTGVLPATLEKAESSHILTRELTVSSMYTITALYMTGDSTLMSM